MISSFLPKAMQFSFLCSEVVKGTDQAPSFPFFSYQFLWSNISPREEAYLSFQNISSGDACVLYE